MTNAEPGTVDSTLHDGLNVDQVLALVAIVGLFGWGLTQYVAWNPGSTLGTVGVEGTVLVLLFWLLATMATAAVILGAGSRAVKYGPPFWLWGILVAVAMTSNAAVVTGLVPESVVRYGLWHPWIGVYAAGYLVMGIVAVDRTRLAYFVGCLLAVIAFVSWAAFPLESRTWMFALTGVVHAGPVLADVALTSADPSPPDQPAEPARNP
ncbi:hypothetical protein [Natrinema amylolyticum]|uniref:hypothetical protein n=1 Tax=Natrinema amylolyticum TaxID=2878679 RepID=UPI001CF93A3A|nr:hypothetical protein [Natrinema amylolyticum]